MPYPTSAGMKRPHTLEDMKRVFERLASPQSIFQPSGAGHQSGFVPDPGSAAGVTRYLREDATWALAISSITITVPSFLSVSPGTITTSGTFAITLANENANTLFAGPASGAASVPTFRAWDARDNANGADALVYANPIAISTTNGKELHTVTTTNAVGNSTFNAADGGIANQKMFFLITNDATAPRTITFGTNFKPNGTLVGVISKTSTIGFVSDGVNWWETFRTVGVL